MEEIRESTATIKIVPLTWEEGCNIIVGQSHFIKTVEDLAEILLTRVPGIEFGLAFSEASGPCLVRWEGNNPTLVEQAKECARRVSAGHSFFLVIKNAFPITVLEPIKACQEVVAIFAATANPLKIIVAEGDGERGIIGVIDGSGPKGVEGERERKERHALLRTLGYKF